MALVVALIAAACGGGSGTDNESEAPSAGVPDDAEAQFGGRLIMGLESESTGGMCLPEAQLAAAGIAMASAIYDPLVAYDSERVPQPFLAESFEANETFDVWTITLREGITFHDGSPLNSAIVKLNLDVARGENEALARTGLSPLLFRLVFANIDTVDIVDDLTLTVSMKTPWVAFKDIMASGRFPIAADAQLAGGKCAEDLIGTGPFELESWTRNSEAVLNRSDSYWRTDEDGQQLPYLDGITFVPIPSSTNRLQALEGGSINAAQFNSQPVFEEIEDQADDFQLIREEPGTREVAYGLVNVNVPPFDDRDIRLHVGRGIDRDALMNISNNGVWDVADQPFDFNVMGHVEGLTLHEYDPDGAAEFFDGKDVSFDLVYATDPTTKALAEEVQRQLTDIGVGVNIKEVDQSALINEALAGTFNVALWRNHPGTDPDNNHYWWHSSSLANFGKINDPELDRLLDAGRSEADPEAREEIYQDIARLFAEEAYVLWNWYSEWGFAATPDIHQLGYYSLPDGESGGGINWGWTYFAEVWMDQ